MNRQTKAKERIANGQCAIAITVNFPNAGLSEFLAQCGFDAVVIDGEHGPLDDHDVEDLARISDLTGATSIVRMRPNPPYIERYLGIGVSGIHIPQITDMAEVTTAVSAAKYAPAGARGLGNFRAGGYGLDMANVVEFMERSNRSTMIVAAVEDQRGLDAIPDIAAIESVDVIMIGTTDLANAMGFPGQTRHPEVVLKTSQAVTAITRWGKAAGLPASNAADIREAMKVGARYILCSLTRSVVSPLTELVATVHERG